MSQKKRVRIYKAGGQQGAYINPTAQWMMQMGGAPQQQDGSEQLLVAIQQGLLNQEDPNDIYDDLVRQGAPAAQVEQALNAVLDTMDQQSNQRYAEESGQSIEDVEEEVQDTPRSTVNADMVNMINEDDDNYDYEDEQDFDDDLFDMAKGGIPKRSDFMKQIKQLGGKIGQGQKPEDVSQAHAFNFLDRVKNINQSAILEKEAEDYYDNTLLPEAQRGREVRRAERQQRRQNRQLNRGFNQMTRNMPVGMMGQGMVPQNLGVMGMPSFYGQSFPQQGMQIPGGYPGIKMANIEVHKTGLFGRPKRYSMTFDYNTADPVKEAAEVTKSAVTSVVDEESTKAQEGKPNATEEVKAIEAEAEASTKRLAKTPEEKAAYKKLLEQKRQEGMTIEEMVRKGLGTQKGLEALLGPDSESSSEMSSGLPTMGTWQDYSANTNAHLGQSNSQSTADPALSLLEDEIASLEDTLAAGKGKENTNIYKENEKRLKAKREELNKLKATNKTKLLLDGSDTEVMTQQPIYGYPGAGVGMLAADAYSSVTGDQEVDRYAWDRNTAALLMARPGADQAISYGRAVYTPPAGAPALGPGRAALPQFPGRPVPQIGSAPSVRGYLPEGNLPAGTQLRMPFQQGGMTNPFTYDPLSEFVYGGSLNKYQTAGGTDENSSCFVNEYGHTDCGWGQGASTTGRALGNQNIVNFPKVANSPKYESEQDYIEQMQEANAAAGINKSYGDLAAEYKNLQKQTQQQTQQQNSMQAQYQRQMQEYMNQQHMRGQRNPYGYANNDYGRVPTMFNPYGRGPGIRKVGPQWMQQKGLPTDAQGNPITNMVNGQPLTKFAVTRSGLFGNPRRWEAEWGTPQGSADSASLDRTPESMISLDTTEKDVKENVREDKKRFSPFNRADRVIRRDERRGNIDSDYVSPPDSTSSSRVAQPTESAFSKNDPRGIYLKKSLNNPLKDDEAIPEDFPIDNTPLFGPRAMAYGGVPRYNPGGPTPLYTSNPFEEEDQSILNAGRRNDYGQMTIPDYSQQPVMNTEAGMANYMNPTQSLERQQDLFGTGQGTATIMPDATTPDGYKTKGKFKQEYEIDPGKIWDDVNYHTRNVTNSMDENYRKRNQFAQMYGWDSNRETDDRFRGNYATNQVAAATNFRDPQGGQMEYSQEGGQYNVGEEVEMTAQEIAKFIAGGGKLKYV